jgi:hypothetical protein
MKKILPFARVIALLLLLLNCLTNGHAAITVNHHWRMGEGEGGNGTVLTTTADVIGGKALVMPGGPICNSSVAGTAASAVGSTLGLYFFTAGVYGTNAVIGSLVNNFGMEFWVNPSNTNGNKVLAYNGDTGANGWGIYQVGSTYQCLFGNVTLFGSATAAAGTWAHLALVRNNGTATFYVNGTAVATTNSTPINPAGMFGVAAKPTDTTQDRFVGYLDELRVFTFTAGQFATSDLLLNAVDPTATTGSASSVSGTGATLNGTVNPGGLVTTYYFQYGTTTSYGSTSSSATLPTATTGSSINRTISGLTPTTLYHFRLIASNTSGTSTGNDGTFTTTAAAPSATTQAASSVTNIGATLNASINPNGAATTAYFQYGLTTNYGSFSSTNPFVASTVASPMASVISGLAPGSLYFFRAVAVNSMGTTIGTDLTFTTTAMAPIVTTQTASFLTATTTTLNASVNPRGAATTAWFEWGIGGVYTQQTASTSLGVGGTNVSLNNQLAGLTAGLPYHYRVVASNALGIARGRETRFWAPVLTLIGANPLTNALNTPYVEPGAAVSALPQTIAAGGFFNMILQPDGIVLAAGRNQVGELNVPASATNIVAIAGGEGSGLAIRSNGTPLGWGENGDGQLNFPASATNLVAMAGGQYHSVGLRADGTIVAWGFSGDGRTNPPSSTTNVIAIAAGYSHSLALRGDGTVVGWGANGSGQTNIPAGATNVIAVSGGEFHSMALRSDGTVMAWGRNFNGQTNVPATATNVVAIGAGRTFSSALRRDGTVVAWGNNSSGETNVPSHATNIVAISVGAWHTLAMRVDGTVIAWGRNLESQLGVPSTANYLNVPVTITGTVTNNIPGNYVLTYSASNSLGAVVSTNRTVVVPPEIAPTVTTVQASDVTASVAVLNASINPNNSVTHYYFQYGLTASYGNFSSTNILVSANISLAASNTISGLTPNTLYHFRVVASNSFGISTGSDLTFTTTPAPPLVTTLLATNLSGVSATLQAVVNPNSLPTSVYFTYGLDTNYTSMIGFFSAGSGTNDVLITAQIFNLTIGTTYHFQAVADNSAGTTYGADQVFTCPQPTVTTLDDGGPGSLRRLMLNVPDGSTITIPLSGTLVLTSGLPVISKNLTINGPGASNLVISGNNLYRPFLVNAPSNQFVNINNLTISNGLARGANGSYGGGGGAGLGGGLFIGAGHVTLSNVVFLNNRAEGGNGASFTNGYSGGGGGGIGGTGGVGGNTSHVALGGGGGGGLTTRGQDGLGNGNGGGGGGPIGGSGGSVIDGSGSGDPIVGGGGGGGNAAEIGGNGGPGGLGGGGGGGGSNGSSFPDYSGSGGPGGFGGGGGAGGFSVGNAWGNQGSYGGAGGFGGGGGGSGSTGGQTIFSSAGGSGGYGGGSGGKGGDYFAGGGPQVPGGSLAGGGGGGGGGAGIGGTIFFGAIATNATLKLQDVFVGTGSVGAGSGGAGDGYSATAGSGGAAIANTMFLYRGTNVFEISGGKTNTIAGVIADLSAEPGTVVKSGPGTLVLSGGNSYTGQTVVNQGILRINGNNTSSSNVVVNAGGTLGGSGTAGVVTLNGGGTIDAAIGTFTAGNSSWSGAGNLNWQVYDAADAAGSGYGKVQVNGTLNLSGASGFNINLWSLSGVSPAISGDATNFTNTALRSWTLVQTTGGIVGFNPANFNINTSPNNGTGGFSNPLGQGAFTLTVVGNNLMLNFLVGALPQTVAATGITATSATLNGTVDPRGKSTTWYFQYGTTTAYGNATTPVILGSTSSILPVSAGITSLSPGTLYHFRLVAGNADGTNYGDDFVFTTASSAPSVVTQPATQVTNNSATLNGLVFPNGMGAVGYFEWGTTTGYGNATPVQPLPTIGLNFNGVNQSASLPTPLTGLANGNAHHTIEAWLNPTLTPSGREWVLLLDGAHVDSHHWLLHSDGTTQLGSYSGGQVNPRLTANVWTHVAATFDGSSLKVYTNGVLVGSTNTSFNFQNFTLTLALNHGESFYAGGMDELRIWNTARTAAQIQDYMNTPLYGNEANLVAYYRMDDGTGSVLTDATSNGRNLQTANNPTWITGAPLSAGAPGTSSHVIQSSLNGLAPNTLYHYRAVGSNSLGLIFGDDLTFTTSFISGVGPLLITMPTRLIDGTFQFDFTNVPGATFSVWGTTNLVLPRANWTRAGTIVENPPGQYRFSDPSSATNAQQFYELKSP